MTLCRDTANSEYELRRLNCVRYNSVAESFEFKIASVLRSSDEKRVYCFISRYYCEKIRRQRGLI